MAICLERAIPLAFHLCCLYFRVVSIVGVTVPFGVYDRMWNSIVSIPDHCLFIYVLLKDIKLTIFNNSDKKEVTIY